MSILDMIFPFVPLVNEHSSLGDSLDDRKQKNVFLPHFSDGRSSLFEKILYYFFRSFMVIE